MILWVNWTIPIWAPKSLQMVTAAMKFKRCLLLGRKVMTKLDSILKDSGGEGEGGMIWENGIETCILSCKK